MNYLLDTHAFLWFIADAKALSTKAKIIIEDPTNDIFLSLASVWEMAIKSSLEKLTIPHPFIEFIQEQVAINQFVLLPISLEHTSTIASIPFYHRDPFDRLLIAQSLSENMPLISNETLFDQYPVQRFW